MKSILIILAGLCAFSLTGQTIQFNYNAEGAMISVQTTGNVITPEIAGPEAACQYDSISLELMTAGSAVWNTDQTGGSTTALLDSSSLFSVTVTDENGCLTTATHWIEAFATPTPAAIEGDTLIFTAQTATYGIPNSTTGSFFEWGVDGGTLLSGYGSPQVIVLWGESALGTIWAIEEDDNGCRSDTLFLAIDRISEQIIPLQEGWNLISTYLSLENASPTAAFADVMVNLEKVKTLTEVYDPALPPPFNTLTQIMPEEGYWVKMAAIDTLILTGRLHHPSTVAIDLNPGWNLIGYTWSEGQPIEEAFSSILPALEKVKDAYGSFDPTLPSVFNTLTTIKPGKGYWVKVSAATNFHFPIPDDGFGESGDEFSAVQNMETDTPWGVARIYPNSTIAYGLVTFNGVSVPEGTPIAAIVDGECRSLQYTRNHEGQSLVPMVINDTDSALIHFRMLLNEQDWESSFVIHAQPGEPYGFLLPLDFGTTTRANELEAVETTLEVFPNPFTDQFHTRILLEHPNKITLELSNANGHTWSLIQEQLMLAGEHRLVWNAQDLPLASGLYWLTLRTEHQTFTTKLIHLK